MPSSAPSIPSFDTSAENNCRVMVHAVDETPLIFKVGHKLFRFPLWNLAMKSEIFEGLAKLARRGGNNSREGFTEARPIYLEDRVDDFEGFCRYFFHFGDDSLNLSEWVGVLAISSKYCIEKGINDAIVAFQHPPGSMVLSPCCKLRFFWEFTIERMYTETIYEIFAIPPTEISGKDIDDLGPNVTSILVATHARVSEYHLGLIGYVPVIMHDNTCLNHKQCKRHLIKSFTSSRMILADTQNHYTGRDVYKKIKEAHTPMAYQDCRNLILDLLRAGGYLWHEETIIDTAVQMIMDTIRTTRPANPRPIPRFG